MCVAVVVESNSDLSLKDLQKMENANSDGGGVAWCEDGKIHFQKGLKAEQIFKLQSILPRPFLLHFRIATRGAAIAALTHPFPLGAQSFLGETSGSASGVIIHNGTWSGFEKYIPQGIDHVKVSDTQVAAYVAGFDESILDDVKWSNAIMRAAGGDRCDVTLRGQWTEHEGNQFSNMHWQHTYVSWRDYADRGSKYFAGSNYKYADSEWGTSTRNVPTRTATEIMESYDRGQLKMAKALRKEAKRERRSMRRLSTHQSDLAEYMRRKDDPLTRSEASARRCEVSDLLPPRLLRDDPPLPGEHGSRLPRVALTQRATGSSIEYWDEKRGRWIIHRETPATALAPSSETPWYAQGSRLGGARGADKPSTPKVATYLNPEQEEIEQACAAVIAEDLGGES